MSGKARFALPPDLARTGVDPSQMDLSRAELRFGLSDPRGLGANPHVIVADGKPLRLQPGGGSSGGRGFFAWVDAERRSPPSPWWSTSPTTSAATRSLEPRAPGGRYALDGALVLAESELRAATSCPAADASDDKGFDATYRIGNLALGRSLVSTGDAAQRRSRQRRRTRRGERRGCVRRRRRSA